MFFCVNPSALTKISKKHYSSYTTLTVRLFFLFSVFLLKTESKNLYKQKNVLNLHSLNSLIGLWCNGNTTVFGAVFQGSSPCRPTLLK
jgi:hypothetical protein